MTYIKDSIYNTGLPIMVIDEKKKYSKYPQIGFGEEGSIHKYNNKRVIKTFDYFIEREKLTRKFEKIEEMARIKDKAFCFPKGLVGYLDLKKEGYFMDLVEPMEKCKNFSELNNLKDMKKVLEYILMADRAIERIHKKGIIIGDIKDDNIMINKCGEIKFIDTDNYAYGDYDFDLLPCRSEWFYETFVKKCSRIDNDKFVFATMAIYHLFNGKIKIYPSSDYFKKLIKYLDVSSEVKEGLRIILSDAKDKPYVGKVLKKINVEERLISEDNLDKLIHYYK